VAVPRAEEFIPEGLTMGRRIEAHTSRMEGASGARQRRALKSESKDVVGDIERKLELRRPETAVAGATGLDVFLILEILPGSKDPKVDIELELEFLGSGTAAAGSTVSPQSQ